MSEAKKSSAKGSSRYPIPALIKQEDVIRFGVPPIWVGRTMVFNYQKWAEITCAGDLYKHQRKIAARFKNEPERVAQGFVKRTNRAIVGLDDYERHYKTKPSKTPPRLPVNKKQEIVNNWLIRG